MFDCFLHGQKRRKKNNSNNHRYQTIMSERPMFASANSSAKIFYSYATKIAARVSKYNCGRYFFFSSSLLTFSSKGELCNWKASDLYPKAKRKQNIWKKKKKKNIRGKHNHWDGEMARQNKWHRERKKNNKIFNSNKHDNK